MKWIKDEEFEKYGQWYNGKGLVICKPNSIENKTAFYELYSKYGPIGFFKKLSSAKEVARLIEEG